MNAKSFCHIARSRVFWLLPAVLLCTSCAFLPTPAGERGVVRDRISGLAVGAVVNQLGAKPLKDFERRRYADQIAAQILHMHPSMDGRIDSYAYVARRMGKDPFKDFVKAFRQHGSLDPRHRNALIDSKLRRRYLMLVGISPVDEKLQLPPVVHPVPHKANGGMADYELVRYQTARVKTVEVQIYDTTNGRLTLREQFSSTDGGKAVVSERTGKRYKGNSLLAAVTNSLGNKLRYGGNADYPKAPSTANTLNYIWQLIAEAVPRRVRS